MIAPQPFFTNRGSPINVFNKLKALSKMKHNITLLTFPEGKDVVLPNVIIKRVPLIPFLRNIPAGPSIHKLVYDIMLLSYGILLIFKKNKYDIIHGHEIDGALIGSILKTIGRKKLLYYDMHSSFVEQMKNVKLVKTNFFNSIFGSLEGYVYRRSDKVLIISPSFKKRLSEFDQEHKAIFLPDNPAMENEEIDDILLKKLKEKFKHNKIILYMGTLEPYQGISLLLNTFKIIEERENNVSLLIVGGQKEQIDKFRELSKQLDSKNVYFIGKQPLEKMPTYLNLSDIVISPRLTGTNIPLKIYVFLRAGKAIVATDIPAHNLILEDKKNALLTKTEENDMVDTILVLLKNQDIKKTIEEGAKKLYLSNFSREEYEKNLEKIYS
ncbi:Phosphatidyl-myo-inositol mannosyltransferase [Methanosarcinales archaeon]|nr:Phosphatidyl-myo-inositol mannosyltransferase [Methanosarcinales archaeon]